MNSRLFQQALRGEPLDGVFVFDAHAHCYAGAGFDVDQGIDTWLARMDAVGVNVVCFMDVTNTAGMDYRTLNSRVHRYLRARPDRFMGYCHINPNYPECIDGELHRCFDELGFAGIKLHVHSGRAYDHPLYRPVYEFAERRRLPVLAHTWGDHWLRQFAAMAREHPNAVFLSAHTGAGDMEVSLDEARRTPNLFLETCFSGGTPAQVERMVREVGAERVIFGTDAALFDIAHQIGKVLFADISDEQKTLILGENARRVFRRPPR